MLDVLLPLLPKRLPKNYCEPFLGGGALLSRLQPSIAYINDSNRELINVYEVIKNNVEKLIADLETHRNEMDYYYSVRDWDRDHGTYMKLSPIKRASRILYLNKTCYNGLYRVNNAGEFNAPFGSYKNPNIVNAVTLRAVNQYLNAADIRISSTDYANVLDSIPKSTFVYLDPPYFPISETANFTGYTKSGFGKDEQIRLKECCDILNKRGIKFMLSNSAAEFIIDLYADYSVSVIQAKRMINSVSTKRGEVAEVVVRNYA